MGRPKGSKNKKGICPSSGPPETEIRGTKRDNPLTETSNGTLMHVHFTDNTIGTYNAGAIPRVVENGMLMIIEVGGLTHFVPIANNIKWYAWKINV